MSEGAPTREDQLAALRRVDAMSEKLQTEGKLLDSLQCMEKSLILRGHVFGLESLEVFRACKSVGEMCNYLAMTYLQQDEFDIALELLKKAEVLTERHKAVRAVTFNNMGCYFRKRGKLRTALNYIRKALTIEESLNAQVKMADTHLNMCTILSELKRHEKAIVHARTALKLLLMELFGPDGFAAPKDQEEGDEGDDQQESKQQEGEGEGEAPRLPPDRVAVLAIAYHNLAVQQEFLRQYKASLSSYEKACKVVTTHLGDAHPLVKSLSDSYNEARSKLDDRIQRQDLIQKRGNKRRDNNAALGYSSNSKGTTAGGRQGAGEPYNGRAALEAEPTLSAEELRILSTFNGIDLSKEEEEAGQEEQDEPQGQIEGGR